MVLDGTSLDFFFTSSYHNCTSKWIYTQYFINNLPHFLHKLNFLVVSHAL